MCVCVLARVLGGGGDAYARVCTATFPVPESRFPSHHLVPHVKRIYKPFIVSGCKVFEFLRSGIFTVRMPDSAISGGWSRYCSVLGAGGDGRGAEVAWRGGGCPNLGSPNAPRHKPVPCVTTSRPPHTLFISFHFFIQFFFCSLHFVE